MPVKYELHRKDCTIKSASRPMDLDGFSSSITIDAPASIYLFLQTKEIFAAVENDGNLEIFMRDHSTLVIENYFTAAAGSRIYMQNDDDVHSYTEYRIADGIETSQSYEPRMRTTDTDARTELINDLLESAKKSQQDAEAAKHLAEQALYRELFKKDNFSSGQYQISYNQEKKIYTANSTDIDFLALAKNQLEQAQKDLEDSSDMMPEISFRMLDDAIDAMASTDVSTMLFWADGKRCHNRHFLDHKGEWNAATDSTTSKNYIQAGIYYDSDYRKTKDPVPLFSALEILNSREKKTNAVLVFEKNHGNAHELVFNLGNAAFEVMKTGCLSNDQKSFISEVISKKKMDAAELLTKIDSLFSDAETSTRVFGKKFQENIQLLKTHATLKLEETFAKNAFHRVEDHTKINLSRLEVSTDAHSRIVENIEIHAQHCEAVVRICKALDQINAIELDFMRGNDDGLLSSWTPVHSEASPEIGNHSSSDDGAEHHAALTGLIPAPDSVHFHFH